MAYIEIKWRNCEKKKSHERIFCDTMGEAERVSRNIVRCYSDDLVSVRIHAAKAIGVGPLVKEVFLRHIT